MPRPTRVSSKPAAANRFARSSSANEDGQALRLVDITTEGELFELIDEATTCGAAVTIGVTRDLKTLVVTFFVAGERYPWYLQNPDDWDAMRIATSVEQP